MSPEIFEVRRRAAQSNDVGIEQCVLGDASRKEDVGGSQLIRVAIGLRRDAFRLPGELRRDRRADAQLDVVLLGVGQCLFDFFVDRLTPVDAFALVGDDRRRPRNRLFMLAAGFVDVDFDAPDARFGL